MRKGWLSPLPRRLSVEVFSLPVPIVPSAAAPTLPSLPTHIPSCFGSPSPPFPPCFPSHFCCRSPPPLAPSLHSRLCSLSPSPFLFISPPISTPSLPSSLLASTIQIMHPWFHLLHLSIIFPTHALRGFPASPLSLPPLFASSPAPPRRGEPSDWRAQRQCRST